MVNYEFKNPHECARRMKFYSQQFKLQILCRGNMVVFMGKIYLRGKTHWENGNFVANMCLLNF
jgi:hypothetical protein